MSPSVNHEEDLKFSEPQKETELSPEMQNDILNRLREKLHHESGVVTDEELTKLTCEAAQEAGLNVDIFDNAQERPLIFYRALEETKDVNRLIKNDETALRPWSYAAPGIKGDLPLAYGREKPV